MKPQIQLLTFTLLILLTPVTLLNAAPQLEETGRNSRLQQPPRSPQQLFKRASRSVFVVEALDSSDSVIAFGSGVAIAPNLVVSNKHVIKGAISLRVRQGNTFWKALIDQVDKNYDLCLLLIPELDTAPVTLRQSSTLAVGERVYALGAPEGLELTFSEGLISGLRRNNDGISLIQTTAPLSHGSSGGGLFDAQGRLVGITTFRIKEGQQLNFALPSDLLLTLKKNFDQWKQEILLETKAFQAEEEASKAMEAGNERGATKAYNTAIKLCLELLRLNPKNNNIWRKLGGIYENIGKYDQALKAYQQMARSRPEDGFPHIAVGDLLQRMGDPKGALNEYNQALQLKLDVTDFYFIGESLTRVGALDGAIIAVRTALQMGLEELWSSLAYGLLGHCLYLKGRHEEAIEEYRKAMRLHGDSCTWRVRIGRVLLKQDKRDEALLEFNEAVKSGCDSDLSETHHALGHVFLAKGEWDKAIVQFRKAIGLDQWEVPRIALAEALESKGDFNAAYAEYQKLIVIYPTNLEIKEHYKNLSNFLKRSQ